VKPAAVTLPPCATTALVPLTPRLPSSSRCSEDAGLIEVYTDEQGREAYRLTEEGVRVGHMLAMVEGGRATSARTV
jgi:hypothetical protein